MRPVGDTTGLQEQPANDRSKNEDKNRHGDTKKKEKARARAKRGKSLMKEAVLRGD